MSSTLRHYGFANKIVSKWLNCHFDTFILAQKVYKSITKENIIKLFMTNQARWNSFKYFIKRVEQGYLTDIWLEEKQEHEYVKTLKKIFGGIEVKGERNKNGDIKYTEKHEFYYTKVKYKVTGMDKNF